MKIQQILLAGATVMLLTTSPVWAERGGEKRPNIDEREHGRGQTTSPVWAERGGKKSPNIDEREHGHGQVKAPEIDAASGTSAIALLTGALLLAGERFRSRRS